MKTSNLANEALRQSEVGMVWEEQLTGAAGSLQVLRYQTFRVRAASAVTVTIDGVLAMTMQSGEIVVFNAGRGNPSSGLSTVNVTVTGTAYLQLARDQNRPTVTSPITPFLQPESSSQETAS